MSQYKIAVNADGDSFYIDCTVEKQEKALETALSMQKATMHVDGGEEFVFDHKDDILVLDPHDRVVYVWNRDEPRSVADYADFKMPGVGAKKVLGWQIVNTEGYNIHGEDDDPFGLASFEILADEALEAARQWVAENRGYRVVEAFAGDIEEPSVVFALPRPASSGMLAKP